MLLSIPTDSLLASKTTGLTRLFSVFVTLVFAFGLFGYGNPGWMASSGPSRLPIIYPAVPENSARLRFFFSESHSEEDIVKAVGVLKKCC
jgi:hypothetical protein